MPLYRRILLAVDMNEHSAVPAQRAKALAQACGADLELAHVVEFVPVEPMGETLVPAVEVEQELIAGAERRLEAFAAGLGVPGAPRHVVAGNVKLELLRLARERNVDLIVLGARERHGVSILVNFTEDAVLHGAPCDVLAVRIAKAEK